jgi:hypothetical protein
MYKTLLIVYSGMNSTEKLLIIIRIALEKNAGTSCNIPDILWVLGAGGLFSD